MKNNLLSFLYKKDSFMGLFLFVKKYLKIHKKLLTLQCFRIINYLVLPLTFLINQS